MGDAGLPVPVPQLRLIHAPHPFGGRGRIDRTLPAGDSIAGILATLGLTDRGDLRVSIDGEPVPAAHWPAATPRPGQCLVVQRIPQGDDQGKVLRVVATIAVIGLSIATGNVAAAAYGPLVGSLAGASVGILGSLAVNALIPPSSPGALAAITDLSPTYSVTGTRNQPLPYGVVPRVYGVHRVYPPQAARPYIEIEGEEQYLLLLFDCGYGPLRLTDVKLGETPIEQFSAIELEILEGNPGDALSLYRNDVDVQSIGVTLAYATPQTANTALSTDEIVGIITFAGLVQFDSAGVRSARSVDFTVDYRAAGTSDPYITDGVIPYDLTAVATVTKTQDLVHTQKWQTDTEPGGDTISFDLTGLSGIGNDERVRITRLAAGISFTYLALTNADSTAVEVSIVKGHLNTLTLIREQFQDDGYGGDWIPNGDVPDPSNWSYGEADVSGGFTYTDRKETLVRRAFRIKPGSSGQWQVRVTRDTADSGGYPILDVATWAQLHSITYTSPVHDDLVGSHCLVGMRVRATDQLQGMLDQFNAVAHAVIPAWTGSTWTAKETASPAWAYADVLRGDANERPVADSRIDTTGLTAWADACYTAGRECNVVLDWAGTVFERLRLIAATGRAAYGLQDGAYSVVRDIEQTTPVQHFTPRNSWNFRGEKLFVDLPHAIKCQFRNAAQGWAPDERIVYDDGYDAETATRFETIELLGITDEDRVWEEGRYHLAVARLRPETYSWQCDVEHLVCTRGDLVRVTHDVPLWGLHWGRIKSRTVDVSDDTLTITLDETVTMEAGKSYSARVRLDDGSSVIEGVSLVVGESTTLTFDNPVTGPDVGDLVLFGETDSESVELIITRIEPAADLSARLTAVDAAPDVHDADTGPIPSFSSQITLPPELNRPAPDPPVIEDTEALRLVGQEGTNAATIVLTISVPDTSGVWVQWLQAQWRLQNAVAWNTLPAVPAEARSVTIPNVEADEDYDVRVRSISTLSVASTWASDTVTVPANPITGVTAEDTENVDGVPASSIHTWATNGQTAYAGTINYLAAGAPANVPSPSGIETSLNSDGSMNVRIYWAAYTQGSPRADALFLYHKVGGVVTGGDHPIATVSPDSSGTNYYEFPNLFADEAHYFGIAAAHRADNTAWSVGAIQSPASTPDWQGVTLGTPDYTANIDGTGATTVKDNAADGKTAHDGTTNIRDSGAPTNAPTPAGITTTANPDGSMNVQISWAAYTQGAVRADVIWIYHQVGSAIIDNRGPWAGVAWDSATNYYEFPNLTADESHYFGISAGRRDDALGWVQTAVQSPSSAPDWQGVTLGTPNYTANIDSTAASTVKGNAANGKTAYDETNDYRDTGAPTNAPTPTGVNVITNNDASIDIEITWAAYTQGALKADSIIVFFTDGTGAPTADDPQVAFRVNTSTGYFRLVGLNPDNDYSFGIAAARTTEYSGRSPARQREITAIQSPTSAPDWQGVTSGTPNYTSDISGTAASTVVSDASDGKTAYDDTPVYRNTGAPTNSPTPVSIAASENLDNTVDIGISWSAYSQGAKQADVLGIFWLASPTSDPGAPDYEDNATAVPINDVTATWRLKGVPADNYYSFGIAAGRRTENGIEWGAIQSPTSTPDWQGFRHEYSGWGESFFFVAGTLLVSIGMQLDSPTTANPTAADFSSDGKVHHYYWGGSSWAETYSCGIYSASTAIVQIGDSAFGVPALRLDSSGKRCLEAVTQNSEHAIYCETGDTGTHAALHGYAASAYGLQGGTASAGKGSVRAVPVVGWSESKPSVSSGAGALFPTALGRLWLRQSNAWQLVHVGAEQQQDTTQRTLSTSPYTLCSKSLPPGDYLVVASGMVYADSAIDVIVRLKEGTTTDHYQMVQANTDEKNVCVVAAMNLTSTTTVSVTAETASGTAYANFWNMIYNND